MPQISFSSFEAATEFNEVNVFLQCSTEPSVLVWEPLTGCGQDTRRLTQKSATGEHPGLWPVFTIIVFKSIALLPHQLCDLCSLLPGWAFSGWAFQR